MRRIALFFLLAATHTKAFVGLGLAGWIFGIWAIWLTKRRKSGIDKPEKQ